MKRKILSLSLAALFLVSLAAPAGADGAATVESEVFAFLTEEMGFCSAAAAGIMANIMCESSFNPNAGDIDTNDLYSYGLVMWNGPRYERLKTWCRDNELSHETVEGQMKYLKWELENGERATMNAMTSTPDTFEGCVEATVLFAELFERCAAFSYGLRVHYAVNVFWPAYGNGETTGKPGVYGVYCNYPLTVKEGKSFTLKGAVVSYTSPLSSVTGGVYDGEGKMLTGSTAYPDSYAFDISKIDRYIKFNVLTAGTYTYRITASNDGGEYTVEEHEFTVGSAESEGVYPRFTDGKSLCGFGLYCPGAQFEDMPPVGDWAHEGIDFVVSRELFLGVSKKMFEPESTMTRAMLVTVLWRLEGRPEPDPEGAVLFEDVPEGEWYAAPVGWASSVGVVRGVDETHFDPYAEVTREQTATFLLRYTTLHDLDFYNRSDLSGFPDVGDVSPWAVDPFSWANATGVIKGSLQNGVSLLDPQGKATRAQVALMLKRFVEDVICEEL
ncbi:MAG: S-layer homology domain-containing protein [Clostridia bacterium]|nr:S-layer homology domain-containing protein [Clostridia bacterium]